MIVKKSFLSVTDHFITIIDTGKIQLFLMLSHKSDHYFLHFLSIEEIRNVFVLYKFYVKTTVCPLRWDTKSNALLFIVFHLTFVFVFNITYFFIAIVSCPFSSKFEFLNSTNCTFYSEICDLTFMEYFDHGDICPDTEWKIFFLVIC